MCENNFVCHKVLVTSWGTYTLRYILRAGVKITVAFDSALYDSTVSVTALCIKVALHASVPWDSLPGSMPNAFY